MVALLVRSLTAFFLASNLDNAGWFPFGIYNLFDAQAQAVLDGGTSFFWIDDPSMTNAAIYPPGYPLWLALVYAISGTRSAYAVQVVQLVLDSLSVLLIVAIASQAFAWRAAVAAGSLAAVSPLLAFYGATPLADAPTSWIVLGGMWMLVRVVTTERLVWAILAGAMIGASCWFRANALFLGVGLAAIVVLCVRSGWQKKLLLSGAVVLGLVVVIAPVVVRNSLAFNAFVPTGLGVGTNLWEGIGETERASEFGAVYGDRELLEKERADLGLPDDDRVSLYWPDGVARDRARANKALTVIGAHPGWYAGVIARRTGNLIKYAGDDSGIYGSTGVNITPSKNLPAKWRVFPLTAIVTAIGWAQSMLRFIILPMMLLGIWLAMRQNWRVSAVLLAPVLYYLVVGSFLHTEIRYSLPAQALLFVFAGVAADWLLSKFRRLPIVAEQNA
jgi:hypothetical protein